MFLMTLLVVQHQYLFDIYKNSDIVIGMKTNTQIKLRSVFSSGMNLGNQIHRTKKGKGAYTRKNRNNKWY